MTQEARLLTILIEAFTDECIEEINKHKHPDITDVFNFGISSAEASVKRIKTKYLDKLNDYKQDDNS